MEDEALSAGEEAAAAGVVGVTGEASVELGADEPESEELESEEPESEEPESEAGEDGAEDGMESIGEASVELGLGM